MPPLVVETPSGRTRGASRSFSQFGVEESLAGITLGPSGPFAFRDRLGALFLLLTLGNGVGLRNGRAEHAPCPHQ